MRGPDSAGSRPSQRALAGPASRGATPTATWKAPKGELGFYLVSDGSIAPYRCKIRSPSLINLSVLRDILIGWKLADMIVTFGSIDINMGEVDR